MHPNDQKHYQQALLMAHQAGILKGYEFGYYTGVKDTINMIGTDASLKLKKGKGELMAYYRDLKSKFDKQN